jgi:hypothetical protein
MNTIHDNAGIQKLQLQSTTSQHDSKNVLSHREQIVLNKKISAKRGNLRRLRDKKLNQSQRALASLADQGCRADKLFKAMNFTRFQVSE